MTPGQREAPAPQPGTPDEHGNRQDECGICVLVPSVSGWVRATQASCPEHGSAVQIAKRQTANLRKQLLAAERERDAAVSALTRVRQLAEAAAKPAASLDPADCTYACNDGECNCSGVWRPVAWRLNPADVLAALPPVDSPEASDV